MKNPALHMFQQVWDRELYGHPRFFELLLQMAETHSAKDHDYTAGGVPYSNIRESAKEVGIPAWKAALIRLGDKRSRLRTFVQCVESQVKTESMGDTLLDLAVYSLITLILYEEEKHAEQKTVSPEAQTGNEPRNRSYKDEMSDRFNAAFQTGYQEKDTGPADKTVPEVPKPECPRNDGSSSGLG